MKVYIAGKITGNEGYRADFDAEEKRLREEIERTTGRKPVVLNPANLPEGMDYADYMWICFAMIARADVVFLMEHWFESNGAKMENSYAQHIGKRIVSFYEEEENPGIWRRICDEL